MNHSRSLKVEFPWEHQLSNGEIRKTLIGAQITYDFDSNYGADADGNRGEPVEFPPEVEILYAWIEIHSDSITPFRETKKSLMQVEGVYYLEVPDPFLLFNVWDRMKIRDQAIAEVEYAPEGWEEDDRGNEK